jgi:hypothetical protein
MLMTGITPGPSRSLPSLSLSRYHLRDTRVLTGLVLIEDDALDRRYLAKLCNQWKLSCDNHGLVARFTFLGLALLQRL